MLKVESFSGLFSKFVQCPFEISVTPLSPPIKNEMKCYCYYLISIVLNDDCLFLLLQFEMLKLIFIYLWPVLSTPTGPYQALNTKWIITKKEKPQRTTTWCLFVACLMVSEVMNDPQVGCFCCWPSIIRLYSGLYGAYPLLLMNSCLKQPENVELYGLT